ncbi:hypothetical protein LKL35_29420 [Streptomyces sp. ET3-23]|uniref:hypothetical protein n=1 Tax=Streptomyces sp. ET3-23 TaxID=2885643 RepID=UPI001D116D7D|nr:hypothetical protein [Streptomyces sp. ET3-23]MCC2279520.1 hypothetical protein [Streptomyces sp. ET3-23]
MRVDPVSVVHDYLRAKPELAHAVTGDLVGREPGETAIYVEHAGGYRAVRDRMDRADITYQVYSEHRDEAAKLAYLVREQLLEDLPGRLVGDALVLDVSDGISPRYFPDSASREHSYLGEVSVFITEG